ncbi:Kynureninase [Zancudomyces culisetae]|uniref:Kynureninase n=1 Tax=Zancudomyces culisetae TaxID=1213189 RepID=A0A1R1PKP7_ZANCU|nr:Kynureninase [Zancudomyces culisetae]OMH81535.1 Kynureninase [Zancudomyces culisetae]|eukprot:OMH80523.1 Kynureninase [Zancudomyces culisetae]
MTYEASAIRTVEEYFDSSKNGPLSLEFAKEMDARPELKNLREEFEYPTPVAVGEITRTIEEKEKDKCIYFCTHSLGMLPKNLRSKMEAELNVWSNEAVCGHVSQTNGRPWVTYDDYIVPSMAKIVGAEKDEVAIMNTLTTNIHILFSAFYTPNEKRHKIIIEEHAFPSDHYAVTSQIKMHGLSPKTSLILLKPREGEETLRTEDIIKTIEEHADSLALVWLPGVQYYTGQRFDIERITKAGHDNGSIVGWDLAHTVGNVVVKLHDWNVDFATWCNYKYLCSGPGAIGGAFVHNKFAKDFSRNRLTGWWSHKLETRFNMDNNFDPAEGIYGFRQSNPPVTTLVCVLASMEVFDKVSMEFISTKSRVLTGYMEYLLTTLENTSKNIEIITPKDKEQRGAMLCLKFDSKILMDVADYLKSFGLIVDVRKPECIRLAPSPLFNTFEEVWQTVKILNNYNF